MVAELQVEPLQPFGARVRGIDIRNEDHRHDIRRLLTRHMLLLFPANQHAEHSSALHNKSSLAVLGTVAGEIQGAHPLNEADTRGVQEIESKGNSGKKQDAGLPHADASWRVNPALAAVLSPSVLPPSGGGATKFVDAHKLYTNLREDMKEKIRGKYAVHAFESTYKKTGSVVSLRHAYNDMTSATHPAVIVHPDTGKSVLFVNQSSTVGFVDVPREESDDLLKTVLEQAYENIEEFVLEWDENDVLLFDNLAVQHYATNDYEERRVMCRVLTGLDTFRTTSVLDTATSPSIDEKSREGSPCTITGDETDNIAIDLKKLIIGGGLNEAIALERSHFDVFRIVATTALLHEPRNLLDVGASTGAVGLALLHLKRSTSTSEGGERCAVQAEYLDDDESSLIEATRRCLYNSYTTASLNDEWPFQDASFDAVSCASALLRDSISVSHLLTEAARVLIPNGVFTFVIDMSDRHNILDLIYQSSSKVDVISKQKIGPSQNNSGPNSYSKIVDPDLLCVSVRRM